MNSEQWEQLWREQAPPPSAVNLDRFYADLRPEPEAWERELDDSQRFITRLALLNLLLLLPGLFRGGLKWSTWPGLLSSLLLAAWLLVERRQRHRIYQDYGVPMRARLDRIELELRARHGSWTNAAFAGGMVLVVALLGLNISARLGFGWMGTTATAVVFSGLMVIPLRAQARLERARLEGALARIDRARAQLGGEPPAGKGA